MNFRETIFGSIKTANKENKRKSESYEKNRDQTVVREQKPCEMSAGIVEQPLDLVRLAINEVVRVKMRGARELRGKLHVSHTPLPSQPAH